MNMLSKIEEHTRLSGEIESTLQDICEWLRDLPYEEELEVDINPYGYACEEVQEWSVYKDIISIHLEYTEEWEGCNSQVTIRIPVSWLGMEKDEIKPLAIKKILDYNAKVEQEEVDHIKARAIELGLIKEEE